MKRISVLVRIHEQSFLLNLERYAFHLQAVFTDADINFVHTLARAMRKIIFCKAGINYCCLYSLVFLVFCKCKDCVLSASLIFHNKLANFASARLLLIVGICLCR